MDKRKISKTTANWLACLDKFYILRETVSKAVKEQYGESTSEADYQEKEFNRYFGETLAGLENELCKSIAATMQKSKIKI